MPTEKDKMLAGELYDPAAPEIQADLIATQEWLARDVPAGATAFGNPARVRA